MQPTKPMYLALGPQQQISGDLRFSALEEEQRASKGAALDL
jgi:hypothetical protein